MFDRILEINKKDAGAINHVMGFCGMEDELILLEEDLFLIKKFVQLFSLIKKKADILSGEEFSSIQLVWPALREMRAHIEKFKKDASIGRFARDFLQMFDSYFK